MLNAYEAVFENGNLKWLDIPPNLENQKFQVIFLQKEIPVEMGFYDLNKEGEQRWGFMEGEMTVPDDIN